MIEDWRAGSGDQKNVVQTHASRPVSSKKCVPWLALASGHPCGGLFEPAIGFHSRSTTAFRRISSSTGELLEYPKLNPWIVATSLTRSVRNKACKGQFVDELGAHFIEDTLGNMTLPGRCGHWLRILLRRAICKARIKSA